MENSTCDSSRDIFGWSDHGKPRKSDPMAVQHRMAECASKYEIEVNACVADLQLTGMKSITATPKTDRDDQLAAFQAHAKLAMLGRAGFDLKSLEEDEAGGWTEKECVDLLESFWRWSEELAVKKNGSPNSSQTTDL